jgi:hypothetical protein
MYVDREHVRRDIDSHVLVPHLDTADAPADAPKPLLDPDSVEGRGNLPSDTAKVYSKTRVQHREQS